MQPDELRRILAAVKKNHADGRDDPELIAQAALAYEQHQKERLETSLYSFVRAAWHVIEPGCDFVQGRHIQAITEHLEAVSRGELTRLLINVPYRSCKSISVSVMWPAWTWANAPAHQWLCFSHSERLATRDTRKMRLLVESQWFQDRWPITFARDQNQKTRFENDSMGMRIAAGFTSAATGEGGDTLLIDDPMDFDDAMSDVRRDRTNQIYDEKIATRLNNPKQGAIVGIGQRLHEQDWFGHVLETGEWEHLVIPMRYEMGHPFQKTTCLGWTDWRNSDGELMWPERVPENVVKREESRLGEHGASGQLQQRPSPRGGSLFKRDWVQLVDELPKETVATVRYYDCAATTSKTSDYTAGVKASVTPEGVVYIEDVFRGRWSPAERDDVIKTTTALDGKQCYFFIEQEPGASGVSLIAHYVRLLRGYAVRPHRVDKAKEIRAQPVASYMEAGNVKILKAHWTQEFLDELLCFPAGAHDDMVDATSGAYNMLMDLTDKNAMARHPLICSGEDPAEERRPFSDDELEDLPDFLKELVTESRATAAETRQARYINEDDWV
jgi:predicted phage terminase large subunit-like protein